jgi:hypothetical protein
MVALRKGIPYLIFFLLTITMTYPVVFRLEDSAFLSWDDTAYGIWALAWNFHKFSTGLSGFYDANIFYPHENTFAFTENFTGLALVAYPLYKLTGNIVFCYQSLVLLSYFLSAVGAYLLVSHLTQNNRAALVSGIVFSFCQYRFGQYHLLTELSTQWIPFAFLFMHRFLERLKTGDLLCFVFFYVLNVLTCLYYGVILVIFLGFGILYLAFEKRLLGRPAFWTHLGLFVVLTMLVLVPVLMPYMEAKRDLGTNVSLVEVVGFSPDLIHVFAPSSFQWILRAVTDWVSGFPQDDLTFLNKVITRFLKIFHRHECQLYLGLTASILAWLGVRRISPTGPSQPDGAHTSEQPDKGISYLLGRLCFALIILVWVFSWVKKAIPLTFLASFCLLAWALLRLKRNRTARDRLSVFFRSLGVERRFYFFTTVSALAFTFGPVFILLERPIFFGPWLPFLFIPGLGMIRHTARMEAVAMLGLSVLAGYGIKRLLDQGSSRPRSLLLVPVLIAAILLENLSIPLPLTKLTTEKDIPEVYQWIRENVGDSPIVEIPIVADKEVTASLIPKPWQWVWRVPFVLSGQRATPYDRTMFEWVRENVANTHAQYHSIYHWKNLLNSYSAYTPETYILLKERMEYFPSKRAVATLQSFGARHLVIHRRFYSQKDLERLQTALRQGIPELELIGVFGEDELYEIQESSVDDARLAERIDLRIHLPRKVGKNQNVTASLGLKHTGERPLLLVPAPEVTLSVSLADPIDSTTSYEEVLAVKWPQILREGEEAFVRFYFQSPNEAGEYQARVTFKDPLLGREKTLETDLTVEQQIWDSRTPHLLKAAFTGFGAPRSVFTGQRFRAVVRVRNEGDTLWLAPSKRMRAGNPLGGWYEVRVDVEEWMDTSGKAFEVQRDFVYLGANIDAYLSGFLPCHVSPGQEVEVPLLVMAPGIPGDYRVRIQLVNERIGRHGFGAESFPEEQSPSLTFDINVRKP